MDPIFNDDIQDNIFQPVNSQGSGYKSVDEFISDRVALMGDERELLRNLNIAQQNVTQLDNEQLKSYVDGVSAKTFDSLRITVLDKYADTGDIEGGVAALAEVEDAAGEETEVRKLASAAAQYLNQFEPYSIAREVARRQYAALLFSKKLEEVGITPDTWGKKAKAFLGSFIPGRRVYQDVTADYSLTEGIRSLHRLKDEEFIKALPDAMDEVMKISGNNPFMFMERMQAYLDPGDVTYLKAFFALDVVDAATMLAGVTKFIKLGNITRATNTPIKILRDTGQTKKAAELNAAAMGDKGVADAARITQADAAQSTSPFGGEGLDPDVTEGFAAETQQIIAQRQAETAEILKPLHDPNFLLRRSAYTDAEIESANTKYLNQFAGRAVVKEQLPDGFVAEVQIERPKKAPIKRKQIEAQIAELETSFNDLSTTIETHRAGLTKKQQKTDPTLKSLINQKQDILLEKGKLSKMLDIARFDKKNPKPDTRIVTVKYRNNDFGELEAVEYDKASRYLNSPTTIIDQQLKGLTQHATKIDYDTARIMDVFMRARNAAVGGLKKAQKRDLDSILLQGDRDKVVYTDMELVNGIRTPEGLIKLTSAEQVGAYRSIRDTFDTLYELKNKELYRQLELGNFKSVFPEIDGAKQTNFVNTNKVVSQAERDNIKRIYNFDTKKIEGVSDVKLENVLDWDIYELKYPIETADELITHVLAKPTHIKPLPKYVLDKRVGYVPKIDKDIFWVAEMVGPKSINGVITANYRTTVRYFDNPLDAKTFAAEQNAKGARVELRAGREWLDDKPGRREEFEAQIFGGLYGGQRGERSVPFGLAGTEAERLGGIEAMEAYMNHIATRMPAVNFRAGLVQRFLNSSKNPLTGESYLANPSDWRSEILPNTPHEIKSGLKAMQSWVSDQVRIPTTEERVWGNLQQKIAEVTSRVPGAGRTLSKWAMQAGAKDVTASMRGLAFHATLGWFNPSQLFVQAMGASLAMSMNPTKIHRIIPRSLALRAAMFQTSEEGIRIVARAALQNEDDFVRMVKAYQKTGLHESTLSTGDWNALQGFPNGAEGIRYVAQKGLIFFKEGERFARNYAWIQAYDEVTKGGKLVGQLSDKMIDQITDLHLHYTLNLNRANRAMWQKGLLSIPTQFWQISTKFIENMLPNFILKNPNGWTGKEKSMVLLGQMALFGAAGIPYGRTMMDSLAHWMQSEDEYGLAVKDPELVTWMQGGLSELLLYNWTGERLDVTNRLSIPAGIEQMIEIMTSEHKTTADMIMGVSGELGSRTWDAIRLNSQILYSVVADPEAEFDADVLRDTLDNVGQIASSWRNYQKARLYARLQYIPDRAGNRIIPIDDVENRGLLLAQALGISPKVVDEYYTIRAFNKSTDEDYRNAAISVMQLGMRFMNDPEMLTNKNKQARMRAEIGVLLLGFTDAEKEKILMQVNERMSKEGYLLPEAMEKALDTMYNKQGTSDLQTNTTMLEGR